MTSGLERHALHKQGTLHTMPKYILPTTDWAPLLKTIVKDAQPGAIIETHTASMYELVTEELKAAGRTDIEVRLLSREDARTSTTGDHV